MLTQDFPRDQQMDVNVPVLEVSLWQQKVLLRRLPRESCQSPSFESNETQCVSPELLCSQPASHTDLLLVGHSRVSKSTIT